MGIMTLNMPMINENFTRRNSSERYQLLLR